MWSKTLHHCTRSVVLYTSRISYFPESTYYKAAASQSKLSVSNTELINSCRYLKLQTWDHRFRVFYIQSLPEWAAFRGTLCKSEFPQTQSNSIFFISCTGKITKVCFKMCNKKIKANASTKENIIQYNQTSLAIKFDEFFFLSLNPPAKNYIKSNWHKLSIT